MGKHKEFQGHKNWNHWNVTLWIYNDESLYRLALNMLKCYPRMPVEYCAGKLLERLKDEKVTHTPDGAPYTKTSLTAALRGMR